MRRITVVVLLVAAVAALSLTYSEGPPVRAADCDRTSVDLTPIDELSPGRYMGYPGGLYPNGLNSPPQAHATIAMGRASEVQPRLTDGSLAPNGKIVLLSLGMTYTTLEYEAFMHMAAADPQISPDVLLVDGAQEGGFAGEVSNPDSEYWTTVDERLEAAGARGEQVQVIWLKEAVANPEGPFPEHAEALRDELEAIVHIAHDRFTNLQIVYLSSRVYGGYAESGRRNSNRLNPEPYAYESAFAVRWLIEKQIGGDVALNPDPAKGEVRAPVLLWGPYLWADGETGRKDGLVWRCSDFRGDGTRPSDAGRQKVANMLMAFLKTHPTSVLWFMADPEATPIPTATELPTDTPRPTNTPGGGRRTPGTRPTRGPSPTPAPQRSYRVEETPSGDQMWISTRNADVQQQLEAITPQQSRWVCGRVVQDADAEWGFRFSDSVLFVIPEPPEQIQSTIREISANPPSGMRAVRCIHVGGVPETVQGPPPDRTAGPGTPTRTSVPPGRTATLTPMIPVPPNQLYLPLLVSR